MKRQQCPTQSSLPGHGIQTASGKYQRTRRALWRYTRGFRTRRSSRSGGSEAAGASSPVRSAAAKQDVDSSARARGPVEMSTSTWAITQTQHYAVPLLWHRQQCPGDWRSYLPDDSLADVGRDEERDARAEAVTDTRAREHGMAQEESRCVQGDKGA
eukprot:333953-Pleurochrysis_carterae.AAC.1